MARPIHTAPKTGRVIFVGDDHGTIAKAFWHISRAGNGGGIWCYATEEGAIQSIEFTPTRWAFEPTDFERD